MKTTDKFVSILLKPLFYITDEELKWALKRKESKTYKELFENELRKRECKKQQMVMA
jgi:hypothetical protein